MDFMKDMSKVEFKKNKELNKYKNNLLKSKYFKIKLYCLLAGIVIIFIYGFVSIVIDAIKLF